MSENVFPRRSPAEIAAELFRSCTWEEAGDPFGAAHKAAYYLFQELIERIGVDAARRILMLFGKQPSPKRLKQFEDGDLMFRLYSMTDEAGKPDPNVQKLAGWIVRENEEFNKSPERNGAPARQTNFGSIDKRIRRLVKERERAAARRLAAEGQIPQPRRKKKTARKTLRAKKSNSPKRAIAQR